MGAAPGSFGFGLNIILPATLSAIAQNSLRMERDFLLKGVAGFQTGNFSLILGTQHYDWFGDFVWFATVLGNALLPHPLPAEGQLISKGDFIVAKTRNETSAVNQITLLFQGEYL